MSRCSGRCCSGCRDEIHEERREQKIQARCIADCSEGEVPDLNQDEEDDEDTDAEIKDGDRIFATGLHQPPEEIHTASTISQRLAEAFKWNQNSPDTEKGAPVLVEDIVRGHHSPPPITPATSDSPRYIPPHKRPQSDLQV